MEFRKAVQVLCDAGVEFVIIGGVSLTFHGGSRITYDLDICYSRETGNLLRLAAALAPYHPRPRDFPPDLPFIWDEVTLRNGATFTLRTTLGDIDLLADVAGVGAFEDVRAHSIQILAFDREVRSLDVISLIASKRAAGRPKDLADAAELESIAEAAKSKPNAASNPE